MAYSRLQTFFEIQREKLDWTEAKADVLAIIRGATDEEAQAVLDLGIEIQEI